MTTDDTLIIKPKVKIKVLALAAAVTVCLCVWDSIMSLTLSSMR